jgi:hypothetical protein
MTTRRDFLRLGALFVPAMAVTSVAYSFLGPGASLSFLNIRIVNLAPPTQWADCVSKIYIDGPVLLAATFTGLSNDEHIQYLPLKRTLVVPVAF